MSAVNSFCRQTISSGNQGFIGFSHPSSTFAHSTAVASECDAKENSSQYSQNKTTEAQAAKISQLFQQAVKIIDSDNSRCDDYVNALKLLVSILKIDPYHARAQYCLGYLYEFHVENAKESAVKWYTLAKVNGNFKAEQAIMRVLATLNPHENKPTPGGKLKTA